MGMSWKWLCTDRERLSPGLSGAGAGSLLNKRVDTSQWQAETTLITTDMAQIATTGAAHLKQDLSFCFLMSELLRRSQMTAIVCIFLYQRTVSFLESGASKVFRRQRRQRSSPANVSTLLFWPLSFIRHTPLSSKDRRGWKCQLCVVLAREAGFLSSALLDTSWCCSRH